jgi:hypothetical protein
MKLITKLPPCTKCGTPMTWERDINLLHLRGLLHPRWAPPSWCSACRIESAEEAMEAKRKFYEENVG